MTDYEAGMASRTDPAKDAAYLVERMFAAEFAFMKSGGQDPGLLAEAFHRDVVVHEPASLPYSGDWRGLAGVADLIRHMGGNLVEYGGRGAGNRGRS